MTRMLDEAREAPEAVARQLAADRDRWLAFGHTLRRHSPASLLTIARGSSDHAAHYAAYLVMARLGRLVASMPMSLVTLYHSQIRCDGLASLAFSQSGHCRIDRNNESRKTCPSRAFHCRYRAGAAADQIKLIPNCPARRNRYILQTATRESRKGVYDTRSASGARSRFFAARINEPAAADRR